MHQASVNEALKYNIQQQQLRRQNRVHFAFEKLRNSYAVTSEGKSLGRPPLHQNHNSFLHASYQPGPSFINAMNHLTRYMRDVGGREFQRPKPVRPISNEVSHQ